MFHVFNVLKSFFDIICLHVGDGQIPYYSMMVIPSLGTNSQGVEHIQWPAACFCVHVTCHLRGRGYFVILLNSKWGSYIFRLLSTMIY